MRSFASKAKKSTVEEDNSWSSKIWGFYEYLNARQLGLGLYFPELIKEITANNPYLTNITLPLHSFNLADLPTLRKAITHNNQIHSIMLPRSSYLRDTERNIGEMEGVGFEHFIIHLLNSNQQLRTLESEKNLAILHTKDGPVLRYVR